ncbi:hypothetical protein [Lysinibacillus capsici]|uniref:hypothetical protein n=1 Tax=Lysinibacillus capsici TaxID=2115968 RepID=UPI0028A179BC|nr:hypothetical protein [Lysinibacillus capsici]
MKKIIFSIFSLITILSFATIFSNEQAAAAAEWHDRYSFKESKHDTSHQEIHSFYQNGKKIDCVKTNVLMRSVTKCKNHPNEVYYSEWYVWQTNHSVSHQ